MKILYIFSISAFALKCEKTIVGEDAIELGSSDLQTFSLDDCFRQNDEYELTLEITCPTKYPAELTNFLAINPDESHTMSFYESKYAPYNHIETKLQGANDLIQDNWYFADYRSFGSSYDGNFQLDHGACHHRPDPEGIFMKFTLIQVRKLNSFLDMIRDFIS